MVAPTFTVFTDAPCPRVEVFFTGFPPAVDSVTVHRLAAGREYVMRGAVRASTQGALSRIDFEVPLNVAVTYRAEMFNAAGLSLGFTDAGTVIVPSVETWMHNPLDPQNAVRVTLLDSAGRTLSRPVPGHVSYPLGRRVGVMLTEPRRGFADVVMDVLTETMEDADRVQAFLGDYSVTAVPVICIRVGTQNPMRVPNPLYLGVLDIPEEDVDVRDGGASVIHRITGDEAASPIPGLFIPLLTRRDINRFYATRAAVNAANLTRASVNRRYELAGFADEGS